MESLKSIQIIKISSNDNTEWDIQDQSLSNRRNIRYLRGRKYEYRDRDGS